MTDNSNASPNLTRPLFPWWFWVVSATITLVWFFGPQIISWHRGPCNALQANEFGDQFGSINTLFSGLAFLGVLAGIFIQGKEFRNQLDEMKTNAQEMTNQTALYNSQLSELKEQNSLIRSQRQAEHLQRIIEKLPFFVVQRTSATRVIIENKGATVFSVKITSPHFDFQDEIQRTGWNVSCFDSTVNENKKVHATSPTEFTLVYFLQNGMLSCHGFLDQKRFSRRGRFRPRSGEEFCS